MFTNKHIAMWTCPRSRSTLITRSFEQLEGCLIFDEPLYAPYLLNHAFDHPEREAVIARRETDYYQVIEQITSNLPEGVAFSFQKQMAKHLRPDDQKKWLKELNNFFLIRNPQEIILSYNKVCQKVTKHDIGMEALYHLFKEIESLTGQTPLVIDSTDLLKNPQEFLSLICSKLGITFSEKMLTWKPGLQRTKRNFKNPFPWLWTEQLPPTAWYSTINQSTGFMHYEEKQINFPDELMPVLGDCLPFYDKLAQYRLKIR